MAEATAPTTTGSVIPATGREMPEGDYQETAEQILAQSRDQLLAMRPHFCRMLIEVSSSTKSFEQLVDLIRAIDTKLEAVTQ